MSGGIHSTHHRGTILVAASLVTALAVAASGGPATAKAKPRCGGKVATIVGTDRGEVIRGTARGDVIVAGGGHDIIYGRGGHDIICGGAGNDKLYGQAGHDKLYGQLHNDALVGGTGNDALIGGGGSDRLVGGGGNDRLFGQAGSDTLRGQLGNDALIGGTGDDACYQGPGVGRSHSCERPIVLVVPPEPAGKPLAIAYANLDGRPGPGEGDVLIAKLLDTDPDGVPSVGDAIVMGRYPTTLNPGSADFAHWTVKLHTVTGVDQIYSDNVRVAVGDNHHSWGASSRGQAYTEYVGEDPNGPAKSFVADATTDGYANAIVIRVNSPSAPAVGLVKANQDYGENHLIDVELYY